LLIAGLALALAVSAAQADCPLAPIGTAKVNAVRDGRTVLLADGRVLRLAAIEVTDKTRTPLQGLLCDGKLRLENGPTRDRYGRIVAFAFVNNDTQSLQQRLLLEGQARVAPASATRLAPTPCWAAERQARKARHGLWADPNFAPLAAESSTRLTQECGHLALVEGKVLSVHTSGSTIYLNFGRRWTRDFSVIILRRNAQFQGGGTRSAQARRPPAAGARLARTTARPGHRGWLARTDRIRRRGTITSDGARDGAMSGPSTRAATRMTGAILALALLLVSCTGLPGGNDNKVSLQLPKLTLPQPGTPPAPSAQATTTAEQRENARILASYGGVYHNPKIHALITKMVRRLVAASEKPNQKYDVTLLNSPAINAFALPTGHLYVSRGLIALANDEAELASVIAHEMGHVIARHAQIRAEQARQAALVDQVMTQVVHDPQTTALALAKSKLALASFSRAQEFEADAIGVGISARAGFDPYGASRFLTDMQRNADLKSGGDADDAPDFLSNHPSTPARVRNALANARQYSAPGVGERDHKAYLADLNGMIYGEDPSEGFVRGRRFLQPKLGFTFLAPPGFTLDNTAQAVLGLKTGAGQAMRLDVVSVPAEQALSAYLQSGWMENVDPTSVAVITINGFPAATAAAKGEHWSFRLYAVRFGSDVYRFIFAAKNMTPAVDRTFSQSVASFRRMSLEQSRKVRPLRIKIVTVRRHDTVAKFARRIATSGHAMQQFRVLNGLGRHARLKPRQEVKIVVE
jgi:predicted Zn-dependent protease/endonuclease YncB( thermonuclease family)